MEATKELKPKRAATRANRVVLKPEATARLDAWVAKISCQVKTKVTRADLTNWLITTRAAELSESELEKIEKLFFDEVKYAEWMVKRLREAKNKGEAISLSDLVPAVIPSMGQLK